MLEILIGLVCLVIIVSFVFAHLLDEHRQKIEKLEKKIDDMGAKTILRIKDNGSIRTETWYRKYKDGDLQPIEGLIGVRNRELTDDEIDEVLDNPPLHYVFRTKSRD